MDKYTAEHILGLSGVYDAKALKAAFRRRASEHHPDAVEARGGDKQQATAKMQEVNEAHGLLLPLFSGGVTHVRCDTVPAAADAPSDGRAASSAAAAGNPYNGGWRAAQAYRAQRQGRRQTTAEYYYGDPRVQAQRRRAQQAWQARHAGAGEASGGGVGGEGADGPGFTWGAPPFAEAAAGSPNPRWYVSAYRFLARFPYRFVLLLAICLLVNVTDPTHAGHTMGPVAFEDFLLFLGLANLVVPFITGPLRSGLLWVLEALRRICTRPRGAT